MTKSRVEVYLHLVWRTKFNRRVLSGELECFVHQRIGEIADEIGLPCLAVNSAWDHVHVLLRWNKAVAISNAVQEIKARTAREWNAQNEPVAALRWQSGYGAISVSPSSVSTVRAYIFDQKRRHREDRTIDSLEAVGMSNATKSPPAERGHDPSGAPPTAAPGFNRG